VMNLGRPYIFSSFRELWQCSSSFKSELAACMEGLVQLSSGRRCLLIVVVPSGCLQLTHMTQAAGDDRSLHSMMVREINTHLQEGREFVINQVRREQIFANHYLANSGRKEKRIAVWLRSGLGHGEVPELSNTYMFGA
jgi:hypothetical protein